jgi:hypothetical protein
MTQVIEFYIAAHLQRKVTSVSQSQPAKVIEF